MGSASTVTGPDMPGSRHAASENLVSTRCGKSMLVVFKVILANMEGFCSLIEPD